MCVYVHVCVLTAIKKFKFHSLCYILKFQVLISHTNRKHIFHCRLADGHPNKMHVFHYRNFNLAVMRLSYKGIQMKERDVRIIPI